MVNSNKIQYSWGTRRRINLASNYLKKRFGTRLQKLTIDAGFTCPNRDGTKGTGGCHFCSNEAFNPGYCTPDKSIEQQIKEGIDFHAKRYRRADKYLAYFQAYSNTYASLNRLKSLYNQALKQHNVIGLIIGTRPDCIDEAKLEYLAKLSEKYYIVIEYGIESTSNQTLKNINRGHSFEDSLKALELDQKYGVYTGAHFIFGLPGETREEMMTSAGIISSLPLHTIKFHQLQIIKGTQYAEEYISEPEKFNLFSLEEYISFISRFLSRLNPAIIVDRLAAETQPGRSLSEQWRLRYDRILKLIEDHMSEHDLWQGKYFSDQNKTE